MSLDVIAISQARHVTCDGSRNCHRNHLQVDPVTARTLRIPPGCYAVGRGGRRFVYRVGTYLVYNLWRRHLSLLALGVEPDEVWDHPRRFRGKPFVELIACPDGGEVILGPHTALKLLRDFADFAPVAAEYYARRGPGIALAPRHWFRPRRSPRHRYFSICMLMERRVMTKLGATIAAGPPDELHWMRETCVNVVHALVLASRNGLLMLS
jgi:hypothetical protein